MPYSDIGTKNMEESKMKKVLAILFAVSLCISSLYTVAFAEEEMSNEMIPVCVSVPEGWDAPCCWAWADDGTNAFEAWPGEQLEPLDDGWYYTLCAEHHCQCQ